MAQISNYIQTELKILLNQVHSTPPKRFTSLKKIKTLIETVQMQKSQKSKIKKSISVVQNAIRTYSTPAKTTKKLNSNTFTPMKTQLYLQFQSDKKKIQELLHKKIHGHVSKDSSQAHLEVMYHQLKQQREGLEHYLQELVAKVQKFERIKQTRQKQDRKASQSHPITQQNKSKQSSNNILEVKDSKNKRKRTLHQLMKKYYEEV